MTDLTPLPRQHVVNGRSGWTFNSSESVNAKMKQITQWRLRKLPDVTGQLRDIVNLQHNEAERAMFAAGD